MEGFAKEMAVVTHHRLKKIDGKLVPDPDAELEEPLIVRPDPDLKVMASLPPAAATPRASGVSGPSGGAGCANFAPPGSLRDPTGSLESYEPDSS